MSRSDPISEVDLHGCRPEEALRRLSQALHTARVRGSRELLVITGRGLGNPDLKPILRTKVETWLKGPEGQRAGARRFRRVAEGGALAVELG